MSETIIQVKNVKRTFNVGEIEVHALRGVDLEILKGQFVVILGASGSGKTTLLNQLGGIDSPSEGAVIVDGEDITHYNEKALTQYRKSKVGWIFQFHNLIPSLSATENVMLALEMMGEKKNQKERSQEALREVGLGDELDRFPAQLSGGQQQRVAIARALVKRPSIIVGDEITGNLDSTTGKQVVDLMKKICAKENITFVVVTHDASMKEVADKVFNMKDGVLVQEMK